MWGPAQQDIFQLRSTLLRLGIEESLLTLAVSKASQCPCREQVPSLFRDTPVDRMVASSSAQGLIGVSSGLPCPLLRVAAMESVRGSAACMASRTRVLRSSAAAALGRARAAIGDHGIITVGVGIHVEIKSRGSSHLTFLSSS